MAGPVIYASSDPATSSGTELYAIDPIAATITSVRGRGIGGAGVLGGFFGGGYGTAGGSGGAAGAGGLSGFGGGGGDAAGGSAGGGASSPNTGSKGNPAASGDPVGNGTGTGSQQNIIEQNMIVLSDAPQPDIFGSGPKLPGTPPGAGTPSGAGALPGPGTPPWAGTPPGPESNLIPNDCTGDCGDLGPRTTLLDCTDNCGGDLPAGTGVQLAAVPEPGLLALLGFGFASLGAVRWRRSV